MRVLACGAALDPLRELWVHELKGFGDLDPLERVSHRFASGVDDESIGYAAESLRLLRRELEQRTERLKELPRDLCPDKRVTRQIAARRHAVPAGCRLAVLRGDHCRRLQLVADSHAEEFILIVRSTIWAAPPQGYRHSWPAGKTGRHNHHGAHATTAPVTRSLP